MNLNGEKNLVDQLILDEALKYYKSNMSKFIITRNYEKAEPYYDDLLHHINLLFKLNIKKPQENSINSAFTQNQSTINQTMLYEVKFAVENLINYEKYINSDSLIKLWNSLTIPIQYISHILLCLYYIRYHYFAGVFKDKMSIYHKIWLW